MDIEFGTARRCINPQVPISLAGYFNIRMWDKVLDDIEVRAVVFRQGPEIAAILHFDLVTVPQILCDGILAALPPAGITGLGRGNITFSAIHTHTAPELRPGRQGTHPDYLPFLIRRSVEALQDALDHMQEGELLCGLTADHRFLFNRRYWMKNGKVMTNPGKLNPEILRPEGDIDPEIPLLAVRTAEGIRLLLCSIVNHTDTIGGNGVSADWSGFTRRSLEKELGSGSMVCTLIGASGNINHFDVSTDRNQTSYQEAERIGTGYAETILPALNSLQPVTGSTMHTLFREVVTAPREISGQAIAEARNTVEKYAAEDINSGADMTSEDLAAGKPAVLKYFAEKLLMQAENHEPQHFYLTGILFGDSFALASLPGEPFVEIGLTLRKGIFPNRICMVASHSNGTGSRSCGGGYIPNIWNYGRGGYEDTPRSNPYSMKTSAILLDAWKNMAE